MVNPSIQFEVHPSSGVPIYRQLMDQVRAMIASGQLADGDLLPSVRLMADELQVNMMTVSKAWSRLEVEGVLERVFLMQAQKKCLTQVGLFALTSKSKLCRGPQKQRATSDGIEDRIKRFFRGTMS